MNQCASFLWSQGCQGSLEYAQYKNLQIAAHGALASLHDQELLMSKLWHKQPSGFQA